MSQRIKDALQLGCATVHTETAGVTAENPTNPSYRNMIRAGFHPAYQRPTYTTDVRRLVPN